jgi:hypothetical protein
MTETQTLTPTEFLLARIDEDEAVARDEKVQPPWVVVYSPGHYFVGPDDSGGNYLAVDPARVLAECVTKRWIVRLHVATHSRSDPADLRRPYVPVKECAVCENERFPCDTLRLLAKVYVGHPDFRKEWR